MRTHGSAEQLEQRRRRAICLVVEEGLSVTETACRVQADRRTVTRWMQAFRAGGAEALAAKPHPGRASFLTYAQKDDLLERMLSGARAQGFDTDLWTCPRVKELIEREYGVAYHVDHIPRLLRSLGFSPQKPQRRAVERDEEAIERWVREAWPRVKKRRRDSEHTSCSRMKPAFS